MTLTSAFNSSKLVRPTTRKISRCGVVETLELRRLLATVPVDADAAANAVLEAAAVGTPVGVTASSSDPGGSAVSYAFGDNAGGRFAINAATGVVTVADGSLLDGPATLAVTVVATDGAGGSASQTFSIAVNNVAPTMRVTGDASTDEGGTYTLNLSASDPGADTVGSWAVDWGDGSGPQTYSGSAASVTHLYADGAPRQPVGTTLLNELKVNAPGPHGPYEYAELRGDPGAALDNLYFVSVEGDADPEAGEPPGPGTAELVVNLSGHSLGASGLLAITPTKSGYAIPPDTTVAATISLNSAGTAMENGTNSFLLISNPTPIVEWTDYDTDNDGALELPAGAVVLDSVGWSDGGASDKVYGGVVLTQSAGVPDAATRFFRNLSPRSAGAWYNGNLAGTNTDSLTYNVARTSQNFPSGGALTPGASNVPANVLPPPRLNEIKVNPPTTTDNPYEYIEIAGGPNQTLSRLFLVSMESDVTAAPGGIGRADMVVNLSSASLGSNGLLVVKSPTGGHAVPVGAAVINDSQLDSAGGGLENGSNSFLLISSLDPVLEGTDYDANNDGVLELPAGATIIDAIGWSDGELGDVVYGGAVLQQAGGGAPHAATRFANDDTAASAAAWYGGALAGVSADNLVYDSANVTANFPAGGILTPGDANVPPGTPPPRVIITPDGYTITATATDEDGSYRSNSVTVTVVDVAPTVAVSGAASVDEGAPYSLTLGVNDPGADTVSSWTIDWGDGSGAQVVSGNPPSIGHVYADGPSAFQISATATNEDGTFAADTLTTAVNNVAPQVALAGDATGARGQSRSFHGSVTDEGVGDTSTAVVDYGDGSGEQPLALNADGAFAFSHSYAASGTYSVRVTVTDDDGGSTDVSRAIAVGAVDASQVDPDDTTRLMLVVGGTSGSDTIQVTGALAGGVAVTINGAFQGVFNPTGRLIVFGQHGDDTVDIGAGSTLAAEVYGDAGNDWLSGGGGTNLVLGGAGNDTLTGGVGRDVLIGGSGADTLSGGLAGDDILVGGATAYDADPAALRTIVREWARQDLAYAQRVSNISIGASSGGAVRLSASTVFNDSAIDTLTGGLGDDWFLASTGDTSLDRLPTETETRV